MKQIHKTYEKSFLIEPTKLTRLVDKIHERLGDHNQAATHNSFEVFLSGNRHEEMTSVNDVLALENSRKQKIQRLLITCSVGRKNASRPDHEVQVDFGKRKSSGNNSKIVEVTVRSDDAGWASRTLSEVEEQVERTWLHTVTQILALLGLLLCMLIFLASQVLSIRVEPSPDEPLRKMWLRDPDREYVEHILSQNRTITDQEMREIITRQLRNTFEGQRPKDLPKKPRSRQVVLMWIPTVTLLVCIVMLLPCYPSAVFLWGDEVDRYARMIQRRKFLWNILIGVTVVGVAGNLLSTKLVSSLPAQ